MRRMIAVVLMLLVLCLPGFAEQLEPTAEVFASETDSGIILRYRNTAATSDTELYGIVLEGLDGYTYKISIFTGEAGAYADDAKVWEIAGILSESVRQQDFSNWPTEAA